MPRIRIEAAINEYQDGQFSAWVHVTKESDDDFAAHAGHFSNVYSAKRAANWHAESICKAIKLAGKKPKLTLVPDSDEMEMT